MGIKRHVGGATLLSNHDYNSNLHLSTTTGFRAFKSNENFDADGTYLPLFDCEENEKGIQFSHEMRLNYNKGNFNGFVGAATFMKILINRLLCAVIFSHYILLTLIRLLLLRCSQDTNQTC